MSSLDQSNRTVAEKYFLNEKYIAYIPLLAAVLALGFDVGFFYAINISLFTLFSLSEHILFALQALPVAMILLFAATMVLGAGVFTKNYRPKSSSVEPSRGRTIIAIILLTLLAAPLIYFIYTIYIDLTNNPLLALILVVILPLAFLTLVVEEQFKIVYYLLSVISVCLVCSFAIGLSLGSAYLNPAAEGVLKPRTLSVIDLKNRPTLTGQIIRSGERGVLLYEPASDRVRFELWGAINSIETTPARVR